MDLATIAFAFSLVLLSGLSTSIGGALAVGKREPGPKFMAAALGLSAGVMLYVSFMEILPEALKKLESTLGDEARATWTMMAAFFAGIAIIAIIDRLVPEEINPHEPATTEEEAAQKADEDRHVHRLRAGHSQFPGGLRHVPLGPGSPGDRHPRCRGYRHSQHPRGHCGGGTPAQRDGLAEEGLLVGHAIWLGRALGALIGFALLMPFIGPMTFGISFAVIAGIMVFISLDELLPTAEETGEHHCAIYGLIAGMAVMAVSLAMFI